jgi:shikimate dehydrogenase
VSRGGPWPAGTTRVAAVIGDPVRHSLSPVIHNAAFEATGLDWVFVAFEVPVGAGAGAVGAMRTLGLAGLAVTMPHKSDVARAVDRLTPVAARLGAVNTVAWAGRELVGDSTDGPGFLDALRVDEGFDPAGRRCLVVGAGGAARAVILALAEAGAAEIVVANRTRSRAELAVAVAPDVARLGSPDAAAEADLVVNATPLGMGGDESLPVDPARLGPGQVVVDLVYHPLVTPLLSAARARGAVAVGGLGMLVHQAAHQFRRWTGEDPPLGAMSAAALAALAGGDGPADPGRLQGKG